MKRIFTLIFVLSTIVTFAQHTVAVTANSDFKTIRNGIVESTFVFEEDLTANQLESFVNWSTNNKALGNFDLVGKTLTTTLSTEGNHRHIYEKMFYLLEVDVLEVMVNGQKKPMDKEAFFAHFNL